MSPTTGNRLAQSMSRPKISIVTVCLNAVTSIDKTLASVGVERAGGVEHIVVDGGSTDGTLEILERYKKQIANLVSEPDQGISDAFNKGILRSTGEIIGLVSADDILVPGAIDRITQAFQEDSSVDVFFGNVLAVEADGVYANAVPSTLAGLDERFVLKHSGMWVTRAAYSRFGDYDRSYKLAMDYEWTLRAWRRGAAFKWVPGFLGAYRAGGINTRRRVQTMAEVYRASVMHGHSKSSAALAFGTKYIKHLAKAALPEHLESALLRKYRQRRGIVAVDPVAVGVAPFV